MTGNTRQYPRFECQQWGGRLDAPMVFKGTSIERDFKSGRIGGKRIVSTQFFADDEAGRAALREWVMRHQWEDIEVYWVKDPRSSRQRVRLEEVHAGHFVQEGLSRRH